MKKSSLGSLQLDDRTPGPDSAIRKNYDAQRGGVPSDPDFATHLLNCARCRAYDDTKPATAAALCLEGARLFKRDENGKYRAARAVGAFP